LGGNPTTLVVTAAPEVGDEVVEGSTLIEVAGRPVMVLQGDIPVYRDLRPGAEGVDVLQLEEALARLGFSMETPDGVWDDETAAAIDTWYTAAGYRSNGISDQEDAALDSARSRVRAAAESLQENRGARDESAQGPTALEILSAESALRSANEQSTLAKIEEDQQVAAAESAVRSAEQARQQAVRDHQVAEQRWQTAQAGSHPDTGLPPTSFELQQLLADYEQAIETLRQADQALTQTRIDQEVAAVQAAAAVRGAEEQVLAAQELLNELTSPIDLSSFDRQIRDASEELADAQQALATLQAEVGTWIPSGELLFLKRLPVRIDRMTVARGGILTGSFMTVTGSELAIRGSVSDRDAPLIQEGTQVFIEDSSLEAPIVGTVTVIAEQANTNNVGPGRHYLQISVTEVPEELVGRNVKVVIPVNSTEGEVLAVPAAALSATADGSTRVEVDQGDGSTRFVSVAAGLAAGGLVEVTVVDGALEEGDLVVVGYATGA
ncbi:MAG: hypothetical protein OEM81_04785, partial [Acidimicrobiia bacterium]|nr:hypothetical protein [Acidimicrobiia bacterium]